MDLDVDEIHIAVQSKFSNGRTQSHNEKKDTLLYNVETKSPFVFSFMSALQMVLTQLVCVIWLPLLLAPSLCMMPADPIRVYLVSTAFLTAGIATSLQPTIGIRLPTVVTPSILYTGSLVTLIQKSHFPCPSSGDLYAMGTAWRTQEWQSRLQLVQGALMFSALFQIVLGFTGIFGYLSRKMTPVSIVPAIIITSLNVPQNILQICKENWTLPVMVILVIALFALGLRNVSVPVPIFSVNKGLRTKRFLIFKMFPVLSACVCMYIYCSVVSMFYERDIEIEIVTYNEAVDNSKWFFLPMPFDWGLPTITMATVVHMIPVVILQSLLSVIVFHSTALACKIGPPTRRAVSRGICVEGITSLIASMWGHSTASNIGYSGLLGITGVDSNLAAVIMIGVSHFTRVSALFANISPQFVAALYISLHVHVSAVGLSMLKLVNLGSTRNCGIIGISLFLGMTIPARISDNGDILNTGIPEINTIITECLSSGLLVSTIVACFLDAIIPGHFHNKNVHNWQKKSEHEKQVYKLPSWQELLCSILEKIPYFSSD